MLCDRYCYPGYIRLLEGIMTDAGAVNLSGNGDERNGIKHCIAKPRHQICRTRTGGRYTYSHASARLRVSGGGMHGALFMAYCDT
ncbi:hypothetical protein SDC9_137237 [bioreactor metagenome]|uniref:Uncharacterized protein n=1 Tax=bioreactor metagenome TaxID=1076179 RepID=A0A645DKZ8_9ZZZZ